MAAQNFDGALHVGASFITRAEIVNMIQGAAMTSNCRAVFDRSGGYYVLYKCNSPTPCTFRVALVKSRQMKSKHCTVLEVCLKHSTCTGFSRPRRKVTEIDDLRN